MKRLTKKIKDCGRTISYVSSGDCKDIWNTPRWFVGNAIDRLSELEDILGDDYDLIRLREIVEADRDGRLEIFSPEGPPTVFYIPDYEDGLCLKDVSGLISKEEFEKVLKEVKEEVEGEYKEVAEND